MLRAIISVLLLLTFQSHTTFAADGDIDTWLEGGALLNQLNLQETLSNEEFIFGRSERTSAPEIKIKITIDHRGQIVGGENIKITVLENNQVITEAFTDQNGELVIPLQSNDKSLKIFASLDNQWWSITPTNAPYRIEIGELGPDDIGANITLHVDNQNQLHQAFSIHQVATLQLKFLTTNLIDLNWWKKLTIHWPADGDYYSYNGNVYITNGGYWDVVGHELGHAIYDFASKGSFGGGQHRIDECYGQTLAFSEGWASFFSATTQINSDDPDAKFEFMVPRRAPLGIEHVPDDVCRGDTNEWRVYASLWDLYDGYTGDDDNFQMPFIIQWLAMQGPNQMRGIRDFIEGNLFKNFAITEKEELLPELRANTIDW